jgi:hypothetical protein
MEHMNVRRNYLPWLALACVTLGLAACGGDDGDGNSNGAPTISGTPPTTAQVGQQWSFQPSLNDPNGDSLTVSVDNKPDWVTLNSGTGLMRGTPDEGDVGTWQNIRMRVSDGQASASLPAFSITVLAQGAASGTALLSWTPPTERVDGSPIDSLSGYRVLYGQASMDYSSQVQVGSGVTSHLIEDLGPGTWYFAVTAIASDGMESAPSQEVSKTM